MPSKMYLGIDIGGTAVKIGIVDDDGKILMTDSCSVNFDQYRTPIIRTVVSRTDHFLAENKLTPAMLQGIGVSATGQINSRMGIVAGAGGNIANWIGTPVLKILSEQFSLPVTVANDANCAVMGEQWKGAAAGCSNVVMITIGTGVGGGIIAGGQLLSGSIGIAGELGHFSIKKDGVPCTCGNKGCYERYASTSALVRRVKQSMDLPPEDTTVNGKYIFEEMAGGNALIEDIVTDWIDDIATGLTGLIHLFNPELVIVGGGVSQQQELFIEPLSRAVYEKTMPCFRDNLKICAARLGNSAGLLGGVYNFIQNK